MERHELENSREFKAAKELEHALNDYGWNEKRFASAVTTFHRTLQQTLFRSMVEVIKIMGSEDMTLTKTLGFSVITLKTLKEILQ